MEEIAQLIAALAFFGAVVVCPIVFLLLKHQRAMAEIIHRTAANVDHQRLEALERELRELKSVHFERLIAEDDRHELGRRS